MERERLSSFQTARNSKTHSTRSTAHTTHTHRGERLAVRREVEARVGDVRGRKRVERERELVLRDVRELGDHDVELDDERHVGVVGRDHVAPRLHEELGHGVDRRDRARGGGEKLGQVGHAKVDGRAAAGRHLVWIKRAEPIADPDAQDDAAVAS